MTNDDRPTPPMQPIHRDKHGVIRFLKNPIVDYIIDNGGIDLNDIAKLVVFHRLATPAEQQQFAQLIGYSISGYFELSYVIEDDAHCDAVEVALAAFNRKEQEEQPNED